MKCMIVDDSMTMRNIIRQILNKRGNIEFELACNGMDALSKYNQDNFDIVITDIVMPEMNGLDLLRKIKEINPSQKVIVCSSLGQESFVLDALKLGANDFIVKPFKPNNIIDSVSKLNK